MADGWYLVSAPIITANMMADSSDRWTVPLGGGVGRIIRVDKLPVNLSLQGFYNVAHTGCRTRLEHSVLDPAAAARIASLAVRTRKDIEGLRPCENRESIHKNSKED